MKETQFSCGFVIYRINPSCLSNSSDQNWFSKDNLQILLLELPSGRYDFPKGKIEKNETFIETAYRELEEETGITKEDIFRDERFQYQTTYFPYDPSVGKRVEKRLMMFLGKLKKGKDCTKVTEHEGFAWVNWKIPANIQKPNIDSTLEYVENYWGY